MQKLTLIIWLLFSGIAFSQGVTPSKELDSLITHKNYKGAQKKIKASIELLKARKSYLKITEYIYYTGKITFELQNRTDATKSVDALIASIFKATDSAKVLRQAELMRATYFESAGQKQNAYDANLAALKYTKNWSGASPEDFGLVESNLAALASQNGNIADGVKHCIKAIKYFENYPKTEPRNLYVVYNSMGATMWYTSKIDSALYYFKKAEKTLKNLEATPINKYYRPAFLQNNMAAIYRSQSNTESALLAMKQTISYLTQFIKSDAPANKIEDGKEFLFQAIENYGGIYKDMGNFAKAQELLEYSYAEKQKYFEADNPELFKSKILLGQIFLAQKEYDKADLFLDEGLAHIKRIDKGNNYWEADALYSKAQRYEETGHNVLAKKFYERSEKLYESILDGSYDEMYLAFTIRASRFYAMQKEREKAIGMAEKAYKYITENQGNTTAFEIQQTLNLGEIYYELGDYQAALNEGQKSENLLRKSLPTETNPLDSTKIIFYKPQISILKTKAAYQLKEHKNTDFLKIAFHEMQDAIALIEHQKSLAGEDSNISLLIDNNSNLFVFAKQLALDLFDKTQNRNYIMEAVSLHESILYNRIRARLNAIPSVTYGQLPNEIIQEEINLRKTLNVHLSENNTLESFMEANTKWRTFMAKLKKDHPKYYKLRFASISKSLHDLEQNIPPNTTVIKYLHSDTSLYAVLISNNALQLFKLDDKELATHMDRLKNGHLRFEDESSLLYNLYTSLWKPFAAQIKTKHIIVVPDRDLFNLNFEMLTSQKISDFKEMATHSLLAQHIISYNYSLFLIQKEFSTNTYKNNFVAFVPEFNDQMKADYKIAYSDSLSFDPSYLQLLSQPSTKALAQKSAQLFKGISFLNERSTKERFRTDAKNHKIIHIGTHAESNNVSPELSRLIFAKGNDASHSNDNYLYTYEIYDTDLSSNLAILTACETGKPTYQSGEGMISLAHAFNYAGSESILTSLWKIDEKSSAAIIDLFYKYINKGWNKDAALQQAKLDYIATADGRTLHPQYWAGLVLIGDTSAIKLASSHNYLIWILVILTIILTCYILRKKSIG